MPEKMPDFFRVEDFVPSLKEALEKHPLDFRNVVLVALPVKDTEEHSDHVLDFRDRREIGITDGEAACLWRVESLKSLFRGDKKPPVLGSRPEVYTEVFALWDAHILQLADFLGPIRDAELKEIFSVLRRRPEGKSLGAVHDYLWQTAAFLLGTRPLSQAEFEAILARQERSCRTFEMGPSSRNYVSMLMGGFEG